MAQDVDSVPSPGVTAQDGAAAAPEVARAAELRRLLEGRRGERHVVAIQDFPDPDAISSGLAYREIARGFDIQVDIMYDGLISHPENLALVNLLGIDLVRYDAGLALESYAAAVYVDNQGTTSHLKDRLDPIFSDVRPLGACATQFTEYLRSGVFGELDAGDSRHVQLATALMHGLHSETDGFVRARPPEYAAAAFLSRIMDPDLLERVLCVQKSRGTMQVIEAALRGRSVRAGFSVAGVGYLRWADRDAIPQAADFLITEENVHTAIVFGLLCGDDGREVISGSLRTVKATMGVDAFLKDALGRDAEGRFYGGGRSRAGGFEVDIGFLAGDDDERREQALKWSLFERRIRRKLFRAAGLEDLAEDDDPLPADARCA